MPVRISSRIGESLSTHVQRAEDDYGVIVYAWVEQAELGQVSPNILLRKS